MNVPRVGVRIAEFIDDPFHRTGTRIIYDPSRAEVYIELTTKHDGHIVSNAFRMTRAAFSEKVRGLGVL